MQAAISSYSAFGKVPTHGDFIRQNASGRSVRAFEEWLQRGLFHIKSMRRTDVEEAYDASPPIAFLFGGAQEEGALAGVLQSSRDAAGRRYPLVVVAELPESRPNVSSLLVSLSPFFDAAAVLVQEGAAGTLAHREVAERVAQGLSSPANSGNGSISENHARYMNETTLGHLGKSLWTHFEDSGKYFLFKNLLDVVASASHDGRVSTGYGLRFPLEAVATLSSTVFWLHVCDRLLPSSASNPTLFWSTAQAQDKWSGAPFLIEFFDTPPPRVLADIFAGRALSDNVFDLQDGGGMQGAEAALAIPPGLGQLLEEESNSLSDFVMMLDAHGAAPGRQVRSSP